MKAVHFGAGNIGRGFIGPVLSRSGYKVCFVGRNKRKIAELQKRGQYPVTLANENRDKFIVDNVTAINLNDTEKVAEAIADAELVTTAVGVSALKDIAGTIARGIELRLSRSSKPQPLHIIACENGIGGSQRLRKSVYRHLRPDVIKQAERSVAFPNTMVDRIVPVQKHADPLEVMVEPFSEWIVPRSGMIGDYNEIQGVRYVDSLDPYLERKLFTVNTGHCSAAYFGYLEGYTTLQEAMADPGIRARVYGVLKETGAMLVRLHGFDPSQHDKYIKKMMERFANRNFKDKVSRVARSPLRKLSPNERLIRPALKAHELGLETSHLVSAIASALLYENQDDPEAVSLQMAIRSSGIEQVLSEELGIPAEHPLHSRILEEYFNTCIQYKHKAGLGFEAIADSLSKAAISDSP
ncbi:mannitol-1-phosphate 5-dehydrogenase [Paenibacillus forsythiae]|uniref:Mannitol-1-phosphate 5-dehydrogenase n=1 Tax=Paenibacillus forsythiae TaxID=365616 RepID=A0ABU3HCG4_9BACL|nr:mannitol-1-phosphate 5-dehydrogenase [Paenibacillus forsythiae]MDT3427380.1 mannitol-1-phosphate 5-dehydrogenase [Paenibacillus forsythiae]